MKICIPVYRKYIVVVLLQLLFFVFCFVFDFNTVIILLFLFTPLLGFLLRCPKCNHVVGLTKNNYSVPNFDHMCKKCGQDLQKCEIESDEITNQRLK